MPQQRSRIPRTAPPEPGSASSKKGKTHTHTLPGRVWQGDRAERSGERMQGRPWSQTAHKTDCTPRNLGTRGNAPNKRTQAGNLRLGTVRKSSKANPQPNEGQSRTRKSGRPVTLSSAYLSPLLFNKANYWQYLLTHHVEAVVTTKYLPTRAQSPPFHPSFPHLSMPMPTDARADAY